MDLFRQGDCADGGWCLVDGVWWLVAGVWWLVDGIRCMDGIRGMDLVEAWHYLCTAGSVPIILHHRNSRQFTAVSKLFTVALYAVILVLLIT